MNMDKSKSIPVRPSLGKGLASLLPGAVPPAPPQVSANNESNKDRHLGVGLCGIDDIVPNQYQPRKLFDDTTIAELAESIKANGIIQPIVVRKAASGYQLIAGERRWRAARLAGLKQVPIIVRRTTDKEALELAIIENIQREDLNCIDTALAYAQLMSEFNLTQDEASKRLGKDRATVANHLRLLKLPQPIQNALKNQALTFGHGRALASLEDAVLIAKLAKLAVEGKWSVRELESQIQKIKDATRVVTGAAKQGEVADEVQLRLRNLAKELTHKLSAKVSLLGDAEKGKITIEYFNPKDLDRVLTQLTKS